jgi:hypothetical protein
MRLNLIRSAGLTSVFVLCLALVPVAAFAEVSTNSAAYNSSNPSPNNIHCEHNNLHGSQTTQSQSGNGTNGCQNTTEGQNDPPEAQHHLAANLLRVCNLHETVINNIMARIIERGTRQTELFSTIAARVENFYTKSGKTVNNYDQLVAAVNAAEAKAQTDLTSLKSLDAFTCNGSNPKGQVSDFRTALQTEIQDLKAYRTSIKNLIVAVKSVTDTAGSSTNSNTGSSSTQGGSQ